ncbi:hypothetical protein NDU88_004110 [Pleurodeles waltl]|uniref:Uncharacterized protein n=1 Tax=Pleurodeles waltl TaxID=8319 RepID=A0AAV7W830_PLEWA|nr:hypothetical protein NDU88_004110 [Pleurodeles waltl]
MDLGCRRCSEYSDEAGVNTRKCLTDPGPEAQHQTGAWPYKLVTCLLTRGVHPLQPQGLLDSQISPINGTSSSSARHDAGGPKRSKALATTPAGGAPLLIHSLWPRAIPYLILTPPPVLSTARSGAHSAGHAISLRSRTPLVGVQFERSAQLPDVPRSHSSQSAPRRCAGPTPSASPDPLGSGPATRELRCSDFMSLESCSVRLINEAVVLFAGFYSGLEWRRI